MTAFFIGLTLALGVGACEYVRAHRFRKHQKPVQLLELHHFHICHDEGAE